MNTKTSWPPFIGACLSRIFYWLAAGSPLDDRGRERYRRLSAGVSMSLVSKVVTVISQIVMVSLAAKYLGPERYGLWMTISASMAFVALSSFGVASGLTNALSEAHGKNDFALAAEYTSTAFAFWCVIAVVLLGAFALGLHSVSWAHLLNARSESESEVRAAIAACFLLWVISAPLGLVASVYNAYQENHLVYAWQIAGQVFSIPMLALVVWQKGSLPWLILSYNGTLALTAVVNGFWLVFRHRPYLLPKLKSITTAALKRIFSSGFGFVLISLGNAMTTQFVTIAIARHLGPAQVTPYEVTFRLVVLATGLWAMFTVPLWGAYGEARTRGDWTWIWDTHRTLVRGVMALSLIGYGLLFLLGQFMIFRWAGVVPSRALLGLLCFDGIILSYNAVNGSLVSGLDLVLRQGLIEICNTVVSVTAVVLLLPKWGLEGVAFGLVLGSLLTNTWLLRYQIHRFRLAQTGH